MQDRLLATGFLAIGPKMLAEDDPVKMEMDIVDEQIDTLCRAFMGLTVGCARCHDHKFDPIPTEDYYALAGIFKSTKTMENFKVVARWYERPLGAREDNERLRTHDRKIALARSEIEKSSLTHKFILANKTRKCHYAAYGATDIQGQLPRLAWG